VKKAAYILVLAVFIGLGIFLVQPPYEEQEEPSVPHDQVTREQIVSFESSVPAEMKGESELPGSKPVESVVSEAPQVPDVVRSVPDVVPDVTPNIDHGTSGRTPAPWRSMPREDTDNTAQRAAAPVQEPPPVPVVERPSAPAVPPTFESAPPASYIYFYTGIPVRPAPPMVVYTGGLTLTVSIPVTQSLVIPVFIPQVVPSRRGSPKLVYPNGVIFKPRGY